MPAFINGYFATVMCNEDDLTHFCLRPSLPEVAVFWSLAKTSLSLASEL